MHVFSWQIQKANHDAAPKVGIELGLIINDMHKALGEVELHMEVWEVGRYAAPQALHAQQRHLTHCGYAMESNTDSTRGCSAIVQYKTNMLGREKL